MKHNGKKHNGHGHVNGVNGIKVPFVYLSDDDRAFRENLAKHEQAFQAVSNHEAGLVRIVNGGAIAPEDEEAVRMAIALALWELRRQRCMLETWRPQ